MTIRLSKCIYNEAFSVEVTENVRGEFRATLGFVKKDLQHSTNDSTQDKNCLLYTSDAADEATIV